MRGWEPPYTPECDCPDHDWMEEAACKGIDPNLFFPSRGESPQRIAKAKAICESCPVNVPCFHHGMCEPCGIWGGVTERERRQMRRVRGINRRRREESA